jgi:aldehyde dehydrogenase (NAD+)
VHASGNVVAIDRTVEEAKELPMVDVDLVVSDLRAHFRAGVNRPLARRLEQLSRLRTLLTDGADELEAALAADLGKAAAESQLTEIGVVIGEIDHALRNLRRWLRPKHVSTPLIIAPAKSTVLREPLGVVLIIAPWNYPVQLTLAPLMGALAAGNTAVLKPSEIAPATSAALARLIPRYLDTRVVTVVEGGVEETTALLAQKFDHIFYTGNGRVGRIVMQAAAANLTPVTLELGGKSPVYVDSTVDLRVAARRVAWGKFMNAGQTCVAPDYLLVEESIADRFVELLGEAIVDFYGADPASSENYGRIVTDEHFQRLVALLSDATVAIGGQSDAGTRFLAPTVLTGVDAASAAMQQEIFGPVLPVIPIAGIQEAVDFINDGDKPLALYAFTSSKQIQRKLLRETSSGAVSFGVPSMHLLVGGLPFGGVGESGMGAYHGERSVALFSHEKAVLAKPLKPDTVGLVYPPYDQKKYRLIHGLLERLR